MDDLFQKIINEATEAIEHRELEEAERLLQTALSQCVDAPQVYNLLGIVAEYHNDIQKASKYYRIANTLDPTYMPASRNLTRVTRWQAYKAYEEKDMGKVVGKHEKEQKYYVEYDINHIGHIRKRGC